MYPWISRTLDFGLQFSEKKCGLYMDVYGNLNFVYENRHSLALHEYLQGGQQEFFFIVFCSIRYQTLISGIHSLL